MRVESDFNPEVVSRAGAMGLMQLMPKTARSMGVADPFDARQNILGGSRYLRILANRFKGDLVLTGCGVQRWGLSLDHPAADASLFIQHMHLLQQTVLGVPL